MEFIHKREHLEEGDVVALEIDTTCRFMIMDDANLRAMKLGCLYHHIGGHISGTTSEIAVPRSGDWNVVIDTGGDTRNICYKIDLHSAALA